VFGVSGLVIGPVIAAFFLVVWEMFAQEHAERPPTGGNQAAVEVPEESSAA
jgi:predicted PurR-regulated permease PerM